MPFREEHNKDCVDQGYPKPVCNFVNGWMDTPSQKIPGCGHRNQRHGKSDCENLGKKIYDVTGDQNLANDVENICMLHRKKDLEMDKGCGCKPLIEGLTVDDLIKILKDDKK